MTRYIGAACGALALAGVALGAQTPTPSQPPTTQPPASVQPMKGDNPVTVTGCLKPFDPATMGARSSEETGAAAAAASEKMYVLTNVKPLSSGTTPAAGAPSAGATSSTAGMAPTSFILKAGSSSVNLAQHENHTVEVTGSKSADKSRDDDGPSASTATQPGAPKPSAGASPHRDKRPTLTVTTLKMVSATCS